MRTSLVENPMSSAFAKAACLTGYILLSLGLSPQAFGRLIKLGVTYTLPE